jgi:UDP:flavonoid glycosyltransferase YjiC (YdhE family)
MLTQMPDLGFYAGRLAATGAGTHIRGDDVTEESVAAAVRSSLSSDAVRTSADRLRAEALSQPTPAGLVARLDQFVTSP